MAGAQAGGAPRAGPGPEPLLSQLQSLQQGRQAGAEELAAAEGRRERLQQELEQLQDQQEALEGLWQQKREALQVAKLCQEELEAEGQRRRGQCQGCRQGLEGAGQQSRQLRAQRRGHRKDFWEQLEAILEEHKRLQETQAPARLEAELLKLEQELEKLLEQERLLLELEEQLGPAGAAALRLVEQALARAEQRLGAELRRQEAAQARRDWLWAELEQLQAAQE